MKKNKNIMGIAQLGNPVLRERAKVVEHFNSIAIRRLIKLLLNTLAESNGVGIAAPQISESWQVIVIASKPSKRYPLAPEMLPIVMINPCFEILSEEVAKDWEGCLSIPQIRALVPRYQRIKINYSDTKGKACESILEGFIARIFQHEYDHLNGLVFLDRVEDNQDIIAETEFQKIHG